MHDEDDVLDDGVDHEQRGQAVHCPAQGSADVEDAAEQEGDGDFGDAEAEDARLDCDDVPLGGLGGGVGCLEGARMGAGASGDGDGNHDAVGYVDDLGAGWRGVSADDCRES